MYTECFCIVLLIFLDKKTFTNLLDRILFWKTFEIKSLELENVVAQRYGLEGFFALLFELEKKLSSKKLSQNLLDEGRKGYLKDFHFLNLLLLEVRKHDFVFDIDMPIFFASNYAFLYLVDVNFSFIHVTDQLNNQY